MIRFSEKHKTPRMLILLLAAAVACMLFGIAAMAADGEVNEITSITLNKAKTDITVEVRLTKDYVKENKSATLSIFEFLPYQSTSEINLMEPVKTFKAESKASIKIPYINGNMNRLYSKFVVAEQLADGSYNIITTAKYIENVDMLAENTEAYPAGSSKKGLQIQLFEDAQQLGVQHTVVNVPINEYMLGENSDAAMSFVYNGQTFYLDKSKIYTLDHRVKIYTEAGITVYFNIILTAPDETTHENIRAFYFDGISPDAALYALNTRNETAMRSFQAFMDYLCARYTRADHAYGFAANIILGFEVNASRVWNNAGSYEMANYVYSYITAFRTAYTAMTSHYSEGRVYISLGNNFCSAAGDPGTTADALQDYPAKDFLDAFAAAIKNSGDIPWGLSINPYASDPSMAEYWNDTLAGDDFETPFITMKNIDVLTRYMAQEQFLYDGEMRSIIIGEFGVSGDPSSDSAMTMQAAAYALAYYTVAQNEDIDAFIYHRHVDHSGETQYYGLFTNKTGTIVEPAAKKTIYNVFSLIDTDQSEEVTSFVKQTVGNGVWGLYMSDKVKYKDFNARAVYSSLSAAASDFEKGFSDVVLFDLTDGRLHDFYPSDSAEYVELRPLDDASQTMLYAQMAGIPTSYQGISNVVFDENALEDAHYITLRVMADAPAETGSMSLMLRLQTTGSAEKDAAVFEGEVQLTPNTWQEVSFKIKDFTALTDGDLDLMKLWIRTADSEPAEGAYGIWLETVTLHTKSGLSVIGWILLILLILVLLLVAGYFALYIRAQYIRAQRRKHRQAEMARIQREQLRMQAVNQTREMNPPVYARNKNLTTQNPPRYRGDDY